MGLVARRALVAGELIIKEKPLVLVKTPNTPKTIINHVAELRNVVKSLSEDDRDLFNSLNIARPEICGKNQGDIRNMGIFHTNAITLKQMDKTVARSIGAAVFPNIARINHSCSPNVVWSYNQSKNMEEVRVVRDIDVGEELVACYIDPILSREERRNQLKTKYNFSCYCTICTLSGQELTDNERQRKEIIGLKNNIDDVSRNNVQLALKFAKMRVERMERLRKEMIAALPQAYMNCYEFATADGEEEIATVYKNRGKEIAKLVRGENSLWSHIK